MTSDEPVWIRATSSTSADVSPVFLRGGDDANRIRLVFAPMLVDNSSQPDATVRGRLVYQRRAGSSWQDIHTTRLRDLKGGEGFSLELSASETLHLYKSLSALYDIYKEDGVPASSGRYLFVDARSPVSQVFKVLGQEGDPSNVLAVLKWMSEQDEDVIAEHFRTREDVARRLDGALGVARLQRFIDEANGLLRSSREGDWQVLLERESWAIAQIYAQPVVIIAGQTYVGGKNIHNRGGNVADFLYANSLTNNCMLVEIKRPDVDLVVDDKTVRNNVLNVSRDLTGAVQQLLQNASSLGRNYREIAGEGPQFKAFSPRLLLIIGSAHRLTSAVERKSFELYRGELRNVEVVTFDELVEKAEALLSLLQASIRTSNLRG